jgi:hypothetical protein
MQVQTSKQAKQPRIAKNGRCERSGAEDRLNGGEREGGRILAEQGMGQIYLSERLWRAKNRERARQGKPAETRTVMGSQLSSPAANRKAKSIGRAGCFASESLLECGRPTDDRKTGYATRVLYHRLRY